MQQAARRIIAVANMRSRNDATANLAACADLVAAAAARGVGLLCLPECFAFMGTSGTMETAEFAQHLDAEGGVIGDYRRLAREHGMWLSLGGFHELCDASNRGVSGAAPTSATPAPESVVQYFNSHLLVDDLGDVVATYRKLHLFDVDYDGGFRESKYTVPGSDLVLVTGTPFGAIGLSTCYDVRFAEMYTTYCRAGADVILVPAAFMPTTGAAHWEVLLRARAVETQCYIAAAAQYGRHDAKRSSFGHALVADPWGTVVAECTEEEVDGLGVAELDFARQAQIRKAMPIRSHHRLFFGDGADQFPAPYRLVTVPYTRGGSDGEAGGTAGSAAAAAAAAAAGGAQGTEPVGPGNDGDGTAEAITARP